MKYESKLPLRASKGERDTQTFTEDSMSFVRATAVREGWLGALLVLCFTPPVAAQSSTPLFLRQTTTAKTVDGTCQFQGSLITCSGRPMTMTLSFNPTAANSSLAIVALLGVNACADDRGQSWNGSSFEFSTFTSGYRLWVPPSNARTDGLTSVTCDVHLIYRCGPVWRERVERVSTSADSPLL
jgi:hypothetical protein